MNNLLLSLGFSLSYKNHVEDRDCSNAETEHHYFFRKINKKKLFLDIKDRDACEAMTMSGKFLING